MQSLENMYQSQICHSLGTASLPSGSPRDNMLRLRAILDDIAEKLPPLLDLGSMPRDLAPDELEFPYHHPSVVSVTTADSVAMPETLGFVLLQVSLPATHTVDR